MCGRRPLGLFLCTMKGRLTSPGVWDVGDGPAHSPPLSVRRLYGRAVCVSMSVYGCAVGGRRWQTGAICSSVTGLLLTDVTAAALDRDELPDLAPIQDRSWSEPTPYIKSRAEDSFVL